jgi:hypothetical protein
MLRRGQLAYYVGPVTARNCEAGRDIILALLEPIAGLVYWDVPQPNEQAVPLAKSLGFQPTRSLVRMWTGPRRVDPNMLLQYAIAGPATG